MNTGRIVLMLALTIGITHAEKPTMAPKKIENVIPILSVKDLRASVDYYEKVLGFEKLWAAEDFGGVSRDGFSVYLAEGSQGVPGKAWVWMGVQDADIFHKEYVESGAKIVMAPTTSTTQRTSCCGPGRECVQDSVRSAGITDTETSVIRHRGEQCL
jgi:predicted enzyme related to lactoylglutathione lyase